MNYLLLAVTAISFSAQSVLTKRYGKKYERPRYIGSYGSNCRTCFFCCHCFNGETALYSFYFAICYATAWLGQTVALNCGSLSVSSLVVSCSLLIPTLYGMLFLNEPVQKTMIIGMILLVISLFVLIM